MEYVRLGHSGPKVGRIAVGCMSFGDPTLGMHSWTLDEEASQPFFSSRYLFPWRRPSLVGPSDELGSGAEAQLRQDVVDVCLHRPGRDVEPGGDLPSGEPTWQSDPNSSPTSPTRSNTTPAKVTPSQPGLHREATPAPTSFAKSQCGGPPTASIPKTRAQPEEPNSKRSRPAGNSASTGISPVQPIRQATRGLTNDRQDAPHLVAGTTTASARTKHPVNVRTGQSHPAANRRRAAAIGRVRGGLDAVAEPVRAARRAG